MIKIPCPEPHFHGCQITLIEGVSSNLTVALHQWIWHREQFLPLIDERIDEPVTHVT